MGRTSDATNQIQAGKLACPLLFSVLLLIAMPGCNNPASRAPLDLSLYFTCDNHGRLVPCGCFTGQFGGMTRLKTVLDAEAPPDAIRLDVGDAIAGKEDYHLIEYRYLLQAFAAMKFDALNIGHREAQLSAAQLRKLRETSPVPILSANLLDRATGKCIFEPYRILPRGAYRIAVVGVLDPRGLGDDLGEGLRVAEMDTTLTSLLPELRSKADAIILLAFTDEATLTSLAQQFYELNVILGGKVRQPAQELQQENRSLIYFTTNESRALGILKLRLAPEPRVQALAHQIFLLHDKIPEAPEFQQFAQTYRDEVRRTMLAMDDPAHLQADMVPGVRVAATYMGSQSCLECHHIAAAVWQKSGHAHAFTTLLDKRADADPKCIGCHTIGFGTLSGYRREYAGNKLVQVGCESCHGPGSLHVRQRKGDPTISFKFRPLAAGDCQKCHYGEFSRPFDWAQFWPPIQHGLDPQTAALRQP